MVISLCHLFAHKFPHRLICIKFCTGIGIADIITCHKFFAIAYSLNSTGPTPTPTSTLGMRLSCNFVNVYTIAYRVQYTFKLTPVHARIPITDIIVRILARKSARVGQVGEDRRACPGRGKLNGEVAGHADILATIIARKSARISVSVSVSVPWNSSLRDVNFGESKINSRH